MREGVVKEERDEHAHILVVTQDTDTGYDRMECIIYQPRSQALPAHRRSDQGYFITTWIGNSRKIDDAILVAVVKRNSVSLTYSCKDG